MNNETLLFLADDDCGKGGVRATAIIRDCSSLSRINIQYVRS
jgi:hypothetical protein